MPRSDMHYRRRIRWAGYAGLVWIGVQLLAFALSPSPGGWQPTVLNLIPVLLLAVGALAGQPIVAILFGAYGIFRRSTALPVLTRFASKAGVLAHDWLALLAIPVAIVYIVGALAAIQLLRQPSERVTTE